MMMMAERKIRVMLPQYEHPPPWIPPEEQASHPDYSSDLTPALPRSLKIRRDPDTQQLGFVARGGKDFGTGIFISQVDSGTDAESQGLKEGDQILSANGFDFEEMDHKAAVGVMASAQQLQLNVKYFPYAYNQMIRRTEAYGPEIPDNRQEHTGPQPTQTPPEQTATKKKSSRKKPQL
ncbi:PDZ domain-containing protein 11-like [Branchiostoma floridae x Branchiostoma belcheri]